MIDKVNYLVKVIEDETFRFIKQSFFNIPTELALEKLVSIQEKDENRVASTEKLAEVEAKL